MNQNKNSVKKQSSNGSSKRNANSGNRKPRKGASKETKTSNYLRDVVKRVDLPYVQTGGSADNDFGWYNKIPAIIENACSISFNPQVGCWLFDGQPAPIKIGDDQVFIPGPGYSMPGVMVIETMPTIGEAHTNTDPINVAATDIYTKMREKVKGNVINYDKTDVIMFIMAADSAYMLYEVLIKAFRTMARTNWESKYMPDYLMQAQGFSPSLRKNYKDFEGILQMFATKLASLRIPNAFSILERHSWMYTNVYTDVADASKAQLYLFKPSGLYVWREAAAAEEAPNYLAYARWETLFGITDGELISTTDQIQKAIDTILEPLFGSSNVGGINSDLNMTFSNQVSITPPSKNDALEFAYSEEVLHQIENMTIWSGLPVSDPENPLKYNHITQNMEDTISGPYIQQNVLLADMDTPVPLGVSAWANGLHPYVFNSHMRIPTVEDVATGTRLVSTMGDVYTQSSSGPMPFEIKSFGSEIVTRVNVFNTWSKNNDGIISSLISTQIHQELVIPRPNEQTTVVGIHGWVGYYIQRWLDTMTALAPFNHRPTLYPIQVGGADSMSIEANEHVAFATPVLQAENMTIIPTADIEKINNACVISMFKVEGSRDA